MNQDLSDLVAEMSSAEKERRTVRMGQHGRFAGAIGEAWRCADSVNRAKIEQTWPRFFFFGPDDVQNVLKGPQ